MRILALGLAAICASAPSGIAGAADCPVIEGGSDALAARSATDRLDFLTAARRDYADAVGTWQVIGGPIFGGITVGYGVWAALTDSEGKRVNRYMSAGKALLATGSMLVTPPKVIAPADSGDDPCARVAAAEAALLASVGSASKARWLGHIGGWVLNLASLLYVGLVYDLWTDAALGAGLGLLVGELKVWTQPDDADDALRAYRAGQLQPKADTISWYIGPMPRGAVVGVRF